MDLLSFKNGYRLKRLQQASKFIKNQTFQLLMALKKTAEEVGYVAAIDVYINLINLEPTCSSETMTQQLNKAEEELLNLAQTAIELMCILNSENQ